MQSNTKYKVLRKHESVLSLRSIKTLSTATAIGLDSLLMDCGRYFWGWNCLITNTVSQYCIQQMMQKTTLLGINTSLAMNLASMTWWTEELLHHHLHLAEDHKLQLWHSPWEFWAFTVTAIQHRVFCSTWCCVTNDLQVMRMREN